MTQVSSGSSRWWLLPVGIVTASMFIALGIVVFQPSFIEEDFAQRLSAQTAGSTFGGAKQPTGEAAEDCSGARASDYQCIQKRYQGLVHGSGVQVAFTELKGAYETNEFVKSNCHQITHVIGRAAVDLYGDIPESYSQGDNFCWSGYYHGAMEAVVAEIGPDKILDEANEICASVSEDQEQSFYHYNCVHGLGHGFMGVLENEVFESLETCDTLGDKWERESCYGGVFMENIMADINPGTKTKYLKADEPLYPCTEVDSKYKEQCYMMQTSYALNTQDDDFGKVFELCGAAEEDYRSTCYQSLGRDASGNSASDLVKTKESCMQGEDDEARSNCVIGAVKDFISYYNSDTQAKEFCESLDRDLRETCLETGERYYETFDI
jgi:hypothetical protein